MMGDGQASRLSQPSPAAGNASTPSREDLKGGKAPQMSATNILAIEDKVRQAENENELVHLIADELRKLVGGRQVIVLQAGKPGKFTVSCVSSLVLLDKEEPFVRWLEAMAGRIASDHDARKSVAFELPAFAGGDVAETQSYPFRHMMWQSMQLPTGEAFAALILARERPWSEQEHKVVAREAQVFAAYWQALRGADAMRPRHASFTRRRIGMTLAAILVGLCSVPMSTLAPVEIIAAQPQRVTAPIDGVIKEIVVEPNRPVKAGQLVLRFEETTLRNRFHIAQQEALVAKARLERVSQVAHVDEKARHELAEAKAQFDLKTAERDFAAELLARSEIRAARDGVLVYSEQDRWVGRPVKTGERLMQIVSPRETIARIELPVADAIVLDRAAKVRLFLDAAPLTAIGAQLTSESYQAEANTMQQLVYRLYAEIHDKDGELRIGARGTAQLQGGLVPLAFYLLRRPISAVRQHIGL